jgi:hypothetical protein
MDTYPYPYLLQSLLQFYFYFVEVMDLLEIGLSVVNWIGLAHDRYRWGAFVNAVVS